MATPLQTKTPQQAQQEDGPRTVLGAKKVELALVTYLDEFNVQQVQLAVVGENNVHLIEGRQFGLTKNTTPQGSASEWLREGIFKALGRKE
jgi:hypothetical protein